MSSPILSESVLSLAAAAKLLPPVREGRPINPATIHRWVRSGVRGPDGKRIYLEGVRVGGCWATSREAIQRFTDALTTRPDSSAVIPPRSAKQRQRASDRAAAELAAAGI